jgi:uncharacterized membrane protein
VKILTELLTTDAGLMSVAGIAFMIGMSVYLAYLFLKHMRAEEAAIRSGK